MCRQESHDDREKTFLHYVGVLIGSEMPQTQTTEAERASLLAHLPGKKVVVEVGVFEGFTTRLLAEAADDNAIVYGVDPFSPAEPGSRGASGSRLRTTGSTSRGRFGSSEPSARRLEPDPDTVDFVFIDADHSLDGISADWVFWSKRCRPGGVIALHDTIPWARDEREARARKPSVLRV